MNANLDTAVAVLAKASLYDPTLSTPDMGVAVAWAEVLGNVARADALAAVTAHYSQPAPRRIMPGDVVAGVKKIRAQRVRETFEDCPALDAVADDPFAYLRVLRKYRAAVANGLSVEVKLYERRDMGAFMAKAMRQLPRVPDVPRE